MKDFLRVCSIISIIIATIKIGLAGLLTPEWIVFIIICSIIFLAGGRKIFIITAALASLALFARLYGHGDAQATTGILQSVLTLALICVGIYMMFRGLFTGAGRRKY
jgi:hypothetical protein